MKETKNSQGIVAIVAVVLLIFVFYQITKSPKTKTTEDFSIEPTATGDVPRDSYEKPIVFSGYDGSCYNLVSEVKKNMNDPDSFEHDETRYTTMPDHYVVIMKYRGNNKFGAKVIGYVKAKVSLDGSSVEILKTE